MRELGAKPPSSLGLQTHPLGTHHPMRAAHIVFCLLYVVIHQMCVVRCLQCNSYRRKLIKALYDKPLL
jgi:hypothetical protein